MPYKSDAQRKWAHTATGMKELGKKTVEEFDKATKGKKLPEKVKAKKKLVGAARAGSVAASKKSGKKKGNK